MKIALVRQKVGFGLGGAENYVASCARELLRLGHEVTVVADYCDLPQVKFLRAPIVGRGSLIKNLSFFFSVKRLLEKHEFDLVYSCARTIPADFLRISDPLHAAWLRLGYRLGKTSLQALRPRHKTILWLEKQALRQVRQAVITNSQLVKRQVQKFYPWVKEKVHVIYNGVDFSRFNLSVRERGKIFRQKLGLEDQKVLLFVGADWKRKGLDLVQKILPKLPGRPSLLVVGGPALRPRKNVHYLGQVSHPEEIYGASDLLVLPTRYDPFANVVLEALATGCPVVTSPLNGASELIRAGETGFVVENTPESLLRAISEILAQPPSPKVCHQSVKDFSWKRHVKQLLALVN